MKKNLNNSLARGFTLVELLIVIAVLGVLAGIILVALNPLEQIARGKDANRINAVGQLGQAVEAYAAAQLGSYPTPGSTWQNTLVTSGELKKALNITQPSSACTTNVQTGFCYTVVGTDALVWTVLESSNSKTKGGCTGTEVQAAVYDSSQGKAGIGCLGSATNPPSAGITLK